MTRRAPFASVWSDHNRAAARAERLATVTRWAAMWGSVALIALIAAAAITHHTGAGIYAALPWRTTP